MTTMTAQSALIPTTNRNLGLGFTGNLGNIDAYISAVNRLPMLTHAEEISLAKRLHDATEGNPFFTKELVRSLVDAGYIARDESGGIDAGYGIEWGPGRHGPGNNHFLYLHDEDGAMIECCSELARMSSGYEPRNWSMARWAWRSA